MNIYNCKILLVDDNRELAKMTADILRKSGYETVVTAYSCGEGMDAFRREKPELVILDIMLPDGDGFTLFRRMRETSMLPILFCRRGTRIMTDFLDWGLERMTTSPNRFCRRSLYCV